MIDRLLSASRLAVFLAVAMMSLTAIAANAQAATAAAASPHVSSPDETAPYKLDTGDKVKVTVYGEDDLSGDFDVDGSGNVRLPLIGAVQAAGLTQHQFELAVQSRLVEGKFLVNPKVSVEVESYRPFTILGEVNKPGEYPYENGMTVLNAVALGGGYTYRADKDSVYIRRKGAANEVEVPADDRTPVLPGDTVRVTERLF